MIDRMTLEELEEIYLNGFADEVSGNVESPTGHFYRVGRYIVTTDNQGFRDIDAYDTEAAAQDTFELLDGQYAEWMGNNA